MEARADARASLLVFHRDRLSKLRDGICRVLDAFSRVLEEKGWTAGSNPDEMKKRLQEIEDASWSRIREHLLDGHVTPGDHQGVQEGRGIANLLLDFTNKLDDVKEALEDRLRSLAQQKDSALLQEVKDLQKKLTEEKTKACELKWKHQELTETSSSEKHYKWVLQQQLREKQDIIAQLQRNGTVQLWEKEKVKLLEGSKQREENLTRELEQLRATHEDLKDRLQRRIKDLEDKVRLERMKDIVSKVVPKDELEADLESLKRQLYTKEADINRLEQELLNQQRLIVGCIKGIQRDLKIISERQEGRRLRKDDMQKMNAILDAILKGAKEARLEITKADLPLHYIALPEDIVAHPSKRISKPSILAPVVNKHLEAIGDSPNTSPRSSPPESPACPRRVPLLDLPHPNPANSSLPRPQTAPSSNAPSSNGLRSALTRRAPSAKAKISVNEVGLITKSRQQRGLGVRAPGPRASSPGISPGQARRNRATSVSDDFSGKGPALFKRRAVSTPVPPDAAGIKHRPVSGKNQPLAAPQQLSRTPSPSGRNGMASAKTVRGSSSKTQQGSPSNGALETRVRDPDAHGERKPRPRSTVSSSGEFAPQKDHPYLIDSETGILDVATTRVCFPHVTEDQIRDHYQQFKKYDTNGDYCLDFTEMMQAVQATVADYYKPRQIKEAMVEIDVDESGSVDFYEYLGISTMLMMKVGKSEIFRSSMVKHAGGSISKVCSIQ